jgi:hypothetical protein
MNKKNSKSLQLPAVLFLHQEGLSRLVQKMSQESHQTFPKNWLVSMSHCPISNQEARKASNAQAIGDSCIGQKL